MRSRPVKVADDPEGDAVCVSRQSLEIARIALVQLFAPLRERPRPVVFEVLKVLSQVRLGLNRFGVELPFGKFKSRLFDIARPGTTPSP